MDAEYIARLASPVKRQRTSPSPPGTPSKDVYSDRFIPTRSPSVEASFSLMNSSPGPPQQPGDGTKEDGLSAYNQVLRNELLGLDIAGPGPSSPVQQPGGGLVDENSGLARSPVRNLFHFRQPRSPLAGQEPQSPYATTPVGTGQELPDALGTPKRATRRIAKVPFKVLDAPALQDDFYLNLVHWSSQNVLAVGLGPCVYLWSACTSKVTKLCDLSGEDNSVTSVAWTQRGTHLAVGTNRGEVQLWDTAKCKKTRSMPGHDMRVGTLAWGSHVLSSGSRDRMILQRDVRSPSPFFMKLASHKQEVCGLKWSFDDQQLASGGNDNKLFIWSLQSAQPVARFGEHTAAVKAIAWSPHQHGILASGGGTADRCIRFWNTLTAVQLNCVDTGSQVCNLAWSKNVNELVSTHGYSQNQIIVWRYPSMSKVVTLTGHTMRVLYLSMSPDGQTIVTGAGDETLRFWNVFPGPKTRATLTESQALSPSWATSIR
eukprot:tig00000144_g9071.t1